MKSRDLFPILLVVLALVVYLPGFTWGIPHATGADRTHAWGNDDLVPLATLAEMHNTFVIAKPDRNVAYPWFNFFLVACAYGPYLVWLYLTGGMVNPTGFYPFGLTDPETAFRHLSWIGRSISIALAVAAVVGAYYIAKNLWGRRAGLLTGLFTIFLFPLAYYARVGNLDAALLGWTSLGLAVFALCLRDGLTVKRGFWLGTFMALAAATKDPALTSFMFLPPVLFWRHIRAGKPHRLWKWTSVWSAPAALTAGFLAVYVTASGILVDPARYVQHMMRLAFVSTTRTQGYSRHPATLEGIIAQAADILVLLVDVMGWPLLIAAIIGFGLALRRDRVSTALALSPLGVCLMLLPVGLSRIHYLLPVALPLAAFAGYAFSEAWERLPRWRVAVAGAALVAGGWLALQTLDLTHDMIHDSRYAAGAWLEERMPSGGRIVYFGFGLKLPHMRRDVESVHVFRREDAVETIKTRQPDYVLLIPQDINEYRQRVEWRSGPDSVLSPITLDVYHQIASAETGYRLVAQFQAPRLLPWMPRPFLSYPVLNPPVQILARRDRAGAEPQLAFWETAPHYPKYEGGSEIMAGKVEAERHEDREARRISVR